MYLCEEFIGLILFQVNKEYFHKVTHAHFQIKTKAVTRSKLWLRDSISRVKKQMNSGDRFLGFKSYLLLTDSEALDSRAFCEVI